MHSEVSLDSRGCVYLNVTTINSSCQFDVTVQERSCDLSEYFSRLDHSVLSHDGASEMPEILRRTPTISWDEMTFYVQENRTQLCLNGYLPVT